jgi:DNA-binding transcriptional regulator YiaG
VALAKTRNKRSCDKVLGKAVCDEIVRLRKQERFWIWQIAIRMNVSEYYVRKVLKERGVKFVRKRR